MAWGAGMGAASQNSPSASALHPSVCKGSPAHHRKPTQGRPPCHLHSRINCLPGCSVTLRACRSSPLSRPRSLFFPHQVNILKPSASQRAAGFKVIPVRRRDCLNRWCCCSGLWPGPSAGLRGRCRCAAGGSALALPLLLGRWGCKAALGHVFMEKITAGLDGLNQAGTYGNSWEKKTSVLLSGF